MPKTEYVSLGRRKRAVARLRMSPGSGEFKVNQRDFQNYFTREALKIEILRPLTICEETKNFDISVNIKGGGQTGQGEALRLALARGLEKYNPELRGKLKAAGLLTRDARIKERKKYGLAGARRAYQFSKR